MESRLIVQLLADLRKDIAFSRLASLHGEPQPYLARLEECAAALAALLHDTMKAD